MRCDPTPAMAPTTPPPAPRSGSRAGDFGSVSLRKLRRDVAEASHHCLACEAKRTFGLPDPGRGPPARRPRRRPRRSPPGGHRSSGERPSQINRLLADAVMARSETPGRDHIDGYPQQGLQILGEPHLIEKRRLCLEVNEEVDVAGRSGIASGNGPEDPHPRRVTTKSGRQDRFPATPQGVNRRYDLGQIRSVPAVRSPWSAAARLLGRVG